MIFLDCECVKFETGLRDVSKTCVYANATSSPLSIMQPQSDSTAFETGLRELGNQSLFFWFGQALTHGITENKFSKLRARNH